MSPGRKQKTLPAALGQVGAADREQGLWTGLPHPALSSHLLPPAPEPQAALQGTQRGTLE